MGKERKKLISAIQGAHTLGSAKADATGYDGTWDDLEGASVFDNSYYKNMLTKGWGPNLSVGGNDERNQWQRIDL